MAIDALDFGGNGCEELGNLDQTGVDFVLNVLGKLGVDLTDAGEVSLISRKRVCGYR